MGMIASAMCSLSPEVALALAVAAWRPPAACSALPRCAEVPHQPRSGTASIRANIYPYTVRAHRGGCASTRVRVRARVVLWLGGSGLGWVGEGAHLLRLRQLPWAQGNTLSPNWLAWWGLHHGIHGSHLKLSSESGYAMLFQEETQSHPVACRQPFHDVAISRSAHGLRYNKYIFTMQQLQSDIQ